ncbi:MAG: hypothetical protein ACTHLU_09780 [Novosphingobium sp.]
MSQQRDFYLSRAEEARTGAEAAQLDNVRERWLRAEAAWTEMADRAERTEAARSERERAAHPTT